MSNSNIDNELIGLLKQEFTSDEQQRFLQHFQHYLQHGQSNEHVIDLDDVYEWIGFTRKSDAKRLLLKSFVGDTDYTILLRQSPQQTRGGHNKEQIMMSVLTFKCMCMMANTERGKSTRMYYVKMENILCKYMKNKQNQLFQQLENAKAREERLKHDTLLATLDKKRTVYLTRVKMFEDGKFIIKLGWSNGLADRNRSHRNHFGSSLLLDVFECNANSEFELFLKRHPNVSKYAYTDSIKDDVKSSETYMVNSAEYQEIIDLIKKNIKHYQGYSQETILELEQINLSNKLIDFLKEKHLDADNVNKLLQTLNNPVNVNAVISTEPIITKEPLKLKGRSGTGNKVQQYDQNFKLIETFSTIVEILRKFPEMSKFGIKHAIKSNTLYHGYRWFSIDHDAESKEYEIPPTVDKQSSIPRLVAMLNKEKTRIDEVFVSQQEAMEFINITRKQTVNDLIKSGRIYKNKLYFCFWDDCCNALKNEYLSRKELPKNNVTKGIKVQQIDATTKEVITTYNSIVDVIKNMCISRASIKRACANNEVHAGFLWRLV